MFGPNEDYTGFSSGLNNTARLQGMASRHEILCMEEMAAELGEGAKLSEVREGKAKNVAEPLRYRALLQLR
jgi:class 3 adenylate cyclase